MHTGALSGLPAGAGAVTPLAGLGNPLEVQQQVPQRGFKLTLVFSMIYLCGTPLVKFKIFTPVVFRSHKT